MSTFMHDSVSPIHWTSSSALRVTILTLNLVLQRSLRRGPTSKSSNNLLERTFQRHKSNLVLSIFSKLTIHFPFIPDLSVFSSFVNLCVFNFFRFPFLVRVPSLFGYFVSGSSFLVSESRPVFVGLPVLVFKCLFE